MKRIRMTNRHKNGVSPFLPLELRTDQKTEKASKIRAPKNAAMPDIQASFQKGGSDPFLGTKYVRDPLKGGSFAFKFNALRIQPSYAFSGCITMCSSSLLQQNRFQSSANRYQTTVTQLPDCSSKLYQQTVKPNDSVDLVHDGAGSSSKPVGSASDAMPRLGHDRRRSSARMVSSRSVQNDRLNGSGLMVRGSTFYARWMIPRPLQHIVGKSHFVKSL